jgi:hypothetical protein
VWRRNGWRASDGDSVANQDLWWKLQAKLRELEEEGILVQFWWIPRAVNEADAYAKFGAVRPPYCSKISDLFTFITRKWTLSMTKLEISGLRRGCYPDRIEGCQPPFLYPITNFQPGYSLKNW